MRDGNDHNRPEEGGILGRVLQGGCFFLTCTMERNISAIPSGMELNDNYDKLSAQLQKITIIIKTKNDSVCNVYESNHSLKIQLMFLVMSRLRSCITILSYVLFPSILHLFSSRIFLICPVISVVTFVML